MERAGSRLKILAFVVAFMFVALSTRLWFLQVLAGPQHERDARDNSLRTVTTDALRGDILDRDGRRLVHNRQSLEVRINRDELGDEAEATLAHLSEILGVSAQELGEELDSKLYYSYQPVPVAEFVPEEVYFKVREEPERFQGVEVVQQSVRTYPQGPLGAHLVGWVGQINAEEIRERRFEGYGPSDLVGKAGLEATYERWLRGTPGEERFLVNSDGEVLREFDPKPAQPGHDLRLSLDLDIQRIAEEELLTGIENARTVFDESSGKNLVANAGAVVVLDPKTGGIVAMASWPSFRPSWFVRGLTESQRSLLFESEQAPMLNRATQITYAPGSTFKPFVALAAVKENIASFGSYYGCPAEYVHPGDESGTVFENWSAAERRHAVDRGRSEGLVRLAVLRVRERVLCAGISAPARRSYRAGCDSGASAGGPRSTSRRRRSGPFRTMSTSPSMPRCIRTAGSRGSTSCSRSARAR